MWLKGKSALITGASRGIGRGIALKLAQDGVAKICVNYLSRESEANETLSRVREFGADGFICRADVSNPAEIQAMFERHDRSGSIETNTTILRGLTWTTESERRLRGSASW